MPEKIQSLFTLESIVTFGGASGAVFILTSAVRKLTKWDSVWLGFIFALLVSLVGASQLGKLSGLTDYFTVFLNGCLLFLTANGMNETVQAAVKPATEIQKQGARVIGWFSSWYRK